MGEVLYTIPVKDAYKLDCECPICRMYNDIEKNAIEFTMGPSYMEDDIRAVTDEKGFCKEHTQKLMDANNRLYSAEVQIGISDGLMHQEYMKKAGDVMKTFTTYMSKNFRVMMLNMVRELILTI